MTARWSRTRFPRSTADKVLAMTPPYNTFVDANDDGTLTVSWLGVDEKWVYRPISPTVFKRVSGEAAIVDGLVLDPGDRISFTVEDGHVRYLHTSQHTIALEKISFLGLGIVQISTFGTIVIVFLLSLLIWPVDVFFRKRRERPELTEWAQRARWLEIGVALLLILGTLAFFFTVSNTAVAYGPTLTLYLTAIFITVGSIAGLLLIPAAVGAWVYRWFTSGRRVCYSLLAVTGPYLLWWANHWNLLGFRF